MFRIDENAKCRKNFLCDFVKSQDFPDALVEVCVNCGKKSIYNKVGGRIDNAKYLRDHIRHTVQPWGKTGKLFRQIYGEKIVREVENQLRNKSTPEEIQREWDLMRKEIVERERKRSVFIT